MEPKRAPLVGQIFLLRRVSRPTDIQWPLVIRNHWFESLAKLTLSEIAGQS